MEEEPSSLSTLQVTIHGWHQRPYCRTRDTAAAYNPTAECGEISDGEWWGAHRGHVWRGACSEGFGAFAGLGKCFFSLSCSMPVPVGNTRQNCRPEI
jgi:hypothetical protein